MGNKKRDFIYVGDVSNAIFLSIKSKKSEGQIFNIGSSKVYSINTIYKTVKSVIKKGKSINVKKDTTELNYVSANIDKAKKMLGFKPQYTLENKIREVVKYIAKS